VIIITKYINVCDVFEIVSTNTELIFILYNKRRCKKI